LLLPHSSAALHVRVATNVFPHVGLVTVFRMLIVTVPQLSLAVGVPKSSGRPAHSFVAFAGHKVNVGAVVSIVAMVCEQLLLLPHSSAAFLVRVARNVFPHVGLVSVFRMLIVTVPQLSLAVGVPKSS